MAGMVLGTWHLYAKLACSSYFVSTLCSLIYSYTVLSIECPGNLHFLAGQALLDLQDFSRIEKLLTPDRVILFSGSKVKTRV